MTSEPRRHEVEILIVEDSATQSEHLTYILQQEGYNVSVARNGVEALARMAERVPTLVVSDVMMPAMDGFELCRRVKGDAKLSATPVILLTSLSDPADVVRGLESGADNFIFKPYEEQYLLARIAYVLANSHLRETESTRMGVEISFAGRKFFITSDRLQILNLLLSTYEAAVQKNRELIAVQDALRYLNENLETKVRERTSALLLEIAERKRTQEALQQAYQDLRQTQQVVMQQERLRALGQLASGVAHDINNSISPIALYTEALLEREPNLSERAREYLTTIQRAIDDVAQTVGRMRQFHRQREPELTLGRVDANLMVQQVSELTRPRLSGAAQEMGVAIELRTELEPDLPPFMGAESEIRDALTNLVFNAVDAMPEGGTLTVRTRAVSDDDASARRICIEVTDTGVGMDEETRRRCLEPFFTTKGERGTGMGLAMVYGMVQRHSAELEIDSEPGKGTTMRATFLEAAAARVSSDGAAAPMRAGVPLRILVVDDDPLLCKSVCDALESDGHTVIATDGGQAGIEAFHAARARNEPVTLVITDLGMPNVDGRKVAAAVKSASPGTPVILLTGWGQRMIAEGEAVPHVDRIMSKPPKLQVLRCALAELTQGVQAPK
jgi:signal transduction histidine kinase